MLVQNLVANIFIFEGIDFYLFFFFYFVSGYSQLANNVVTDSGEQFRDLDIHTHVSIFLQIPLSFRAPHIIPLENKEKIKNTDSV